MTIYHRITLMLVDILVRHPATRSTGQKIFRNHPANPF